MRNRRASLACLARSLVVVVGLCLCPSLAGAQKLTVQGDRFAIDGTPTFLTFISYFAATGAPNVTADLHFLKSIGFDGIRIWPNIPTVPQLMNPDGSLKPDRLAHLRSVLDLAHQERLVVDVTFNYVAGMTPATAKIGIVATADALRSYDNLLFDIENERNVLDGRYMSEADVGIIYAAVKATDPARITTASNALGEEWGPQYGADFTTRLGLDVTAFHETRASNWYTLSVQQTIIRTLRSNGKPAYMQEPNVTRDSLYYYPSGDRAEYFLQAIANAKLSGAAAWCFHTEIGVDFGDADGPPFIESRLRAYPEPEWAFVNSLKARVVLRTNNGVNFMAAEGGGGAGIRADRTAASPGSWEVLGVMDLTGGPLISGDHVALATADGTHYVQSANGGGGSLNASSKNVGALETFTIEKPSGGIIHDGDAVSLRAGDGPWYVSANGGGGSAVTAAGPARGPWETFTVLFVTPHSTEWALPSSQSTPPARKR